MPAEVMPCTGTAGAPDAVSVSADLAGHAVECVVVGTAGLCKAPQATQWQGKECVVQECGDLRRPCCATGQLWADTCTTFTPQRQYLALGSLQSVAPAAAGQPSPTPSTHTPWHWLSLMVSCTPHSWKPRGQMPVAAGRQRLKRRRPVGSLAGELQLNMPAARRMPQYAPVTLRSSRLVQRSQWKTSFSERRTRLMRYKCLQHQNIAAVRRKRSGVVGVMIKETGSL